LAQVISLFYCRIDSETMGLKAETEVRGPERFFYDASTFPASYSIALSAARASPVPRGDGAAGEAVDLGARQERSSSKSPGKPEKTRPRVCVMCDHCWRAKRTGRCEILRCPNCLSTQPGDDALTPEDFQDMADRCIQWDLELAKQRKAKMAAASHARSAMRKRGYLPGASDSD